MSALWAVWFLGCGLVAWGCLRAARDYRDDTPAVRPVWHAERQRWTHEPADPDRQHGIDDVLLAACRRIWNPTDHQTTKGD